MATSLERFNETVTRLEGNEQRINIFANDPENEGFYSTNLTPVQRVETLPHFMGRIQDRYLSVFYKGYWAPNTAYSQNDIVQRSDGTFWLVTRPHTSSSEITTDIENRNLIPYENSLAPAESNLRWPWVASSAVASGEILNLPKAYQPYRDSLILFYQGAVCSPRKEGIESSGLYQYEEIDSGSLSTQVRVFFPISAGDVLDMFVGASEFSGVKEAAEAARDEAVAAANAAKVSESVVTTALDAIEAEVSTATQSINAAVTLGQTSINSTVTQAQTSLNLLAEQTQTQIISVTTQAQSTIETTVLQASLQMHDLLSMATEASKAANQSAVYASNSAQEAGLILDEIRATQGAATYLPAYNFGDPSSHPDWQQSLTDYALQFFTDRDTVPNSTFVQNLWNNNEWVFNVELNSWTNNGVMSVTTGSNESLGVVKGDASTPGKISIEADGTMSVNGFDNLTIPIATNVSLGKVKGTSSIAGMISVEADGSMKVNGFDSLIPNTLELKTTAPLTGGGQLNVTRTLSLNAAGAATETGNGTPGYVIYGADNAPDNSRSVAVTPQMLSVKTATTRSVIKQTSTLAANANFTVPSYIVGSNKLKVWYNGARCYPGADTTIHQYVEVGTSGSTSAIIQFNFALSINDVILVEVK